MYLNIHKVFSAGCLFYGSLKQTVVPCCKQMPPMHLGRRTEVVLADLEEVIHASEKLGVGGKPEYQGTLIT